MTNQTLLERNKQDIDAELVQDFKEGLEELRQGKIIKC